MEEEAVIGDVLPIAQAAHNSQGLVIAQVRRLLDTPAPPQQVRVRPAGHSCGGCPTAMITGKPSRSHTTLVIVSRQPWKMANCAICCLRCRPTFDASLLLEHVMNYSAGLLPIWNWASGRCGRIAAERQLLADVTLTLESGPIGGIPVGGPQFRRFFTSGKQSLTNRRSSISMTAADWTSPP